MTKKQPRWRHEKQLQTHTSRELSDHFAVVSIYYIYFVLREIVQFTCAVVFFPGFFAVQISIIITVLRRFPI